MFKLLNLFFGGEDRRGAESARVRRKYAYFKSLLEKNHRSLALLTELEQLLYDNRPFTLDEVVARSEDLISLVYDLAEDLNALAGGKYPGLFTATERIGVTVLRDLVRRKRLKPTELVLPLRTLSASLADAVGGKAANLGEVANRVGLPTPRGFAVSAYACQHFLRVTNLDAEIAERMRGVDYRDTEKLTSACAALRERILAARVPEDLARGMAREMNELAALCGPEVRVSVRSSATSEDSEASFAGQHATVLNVDAAGVPAAWKEVVASAYSPRAVFYRRRMGYSDQDVIMAALCVTMVDARASGVIYTRDPSRPESEDLLVSAAWGLGVSVVDGSGETDFARVSRRGMTVAERSVARKMRRQVLRAGAPEGSVSEAVPEAMRAAPCLGDSALLKLAEWGRRLEEHYGRALDIEWAEDAAGRLFILQARPLGREAAPEVCPAPGANAVIPGREIVLRGGATACTGAAAGTAYLLDEAHPLAAVPENSVLVARQTSPAYVPVMGRIRALLTDVGSVTGHMASVAREFGLPALVGTETATASIRHGEEITVDAGARVVYRGTVPELVRDKPCVNVMKGSPVYRAAEEALRHMAPLTLHDPKAENFTPEGCVSLHDVIRFSHEMGIREMFDIGDDIDDAADGGAVRLRAGLPLNILVVDLGGGLVPDAPRKVVELRHVKCVPFAALLKGMTHPGVNWLGGVGVSLKGFASIVAESLLSNPNADGSMGGPNYAVASDHYLNFNSRLGYHYAVVDTFCGPVLSENYVAFSFKGGAADIVRRSRRARLIAEILKRLGFSVDVRGDMVRGEMRKRSQEDMQRTLDMVGRLLGAIRLLDMLLSDDGQIAWYVEQFFKGNYSFSRTEGEPPPEREGR